MAQCTLKSCLKNAYIPYESQIIFTDLPSHDFWKIHTAWEDALKLLRFYQLLSGGKENLTRLQLQMEWANNIDNHQVICKPLRPLLRYDKTCQHMKETYLSNLRDQKVLVLGRLNVIDFWINLCHFCTQWDSKVLLSVLFRFPEGWYWKCICNHSYILNVRLFLFFLKMTLKAVNLFSSNCI